MAERQRGHIDQYTRIEVYLPFKTQQEIRAARHLIQHVQSARRQGQRHRYTGLTLTSQSPPVFQGSWWSKKLGKWLIDHLVILTLDLDIPYSDLRQVTQEAHELKRLTNQFYTTMGARQLDIWVVTYAIGHVQ
jgi:hypothetical protein